MIPETNLLETLPENAPTLLAAIGTAVLIIRWYRSRAMQAVLPQAMTWSNLHKAARLGIVFATSLLTTWGAGIATNQTRWQALAAAIPVACGAVATHKATRAVGYAHTRAKLRQEGGDYRPGTIRTALGAVLPVDRKAINKQRDIEASDARRERNA